MFNTPNPATFTPYDKIPPGPGTATLWSYTLGYSAGARGGPETNNIAANARGGVGGLVMVEY